MSRKRTVADAVIRMPAAAAEAMLGELTPEQRAAVTPTQASTIMQICTSAARGIAFVLERPTAKLIPLGDPEQMRLVEENQKPEGASDGR